MNEFSVEWQPDAEDELAIAWLQASDRRAVSDAQAKIDRLLSRDPLGSGQEVAEGLLKIYVAPLVAYYEVDPVARRVLVSKTALSPGAS